MRQRTISRELALQTLYQLNFQNNLQGFDVDDILMKLGELSKDSLQINTKIIEYAKELINGYFNHQHQIDNIIRQCATNWKFERIALVDRVILQLATYELVFRDDIPSAVGMNEAIELAKKYSDINSASFVNGILDKIVSQNIKSS
ncbi:MAG: transcription antitermination factor NusB [Planctomycetota bacterium]